MKNIEECLKYVRENYKAESDKAGRKTIKTEFTRFMDNEVPEIFYRELPELDRNNYIIKAGHGSGNMADIPHIEIMDKRNNGDVTPQRGYYVVILFNIESNKNYISLNQGTKWFEDNSKKGKQNKNIKLVTEKLREELNLYLQKELKWNIEKNNLQLNGRRSDEYKLANIFSIDCTEFKDKDIVKLIKDMLKALNKVLEITGKDWEKYNRSIIGDEIKDFNNIEKPLNQARTKNIDGKNILLYGVPGCGKSSYVERNLLNNFDEKERILFYPDYSYSDFVCQVMPSVDNKGNITYKYEPGPFTRILMKAILNPKKNYALIIEEINRGNAPAIFGDIFQLLDRLREDKNGYKKGDSEYGINNELIQKCFIQSKITDVNEIYIPNNLTIIATMNSSDQNVFQLDTAFKRRWNFKRIPNKFTDEHDYRKTPIPIPGDQTCTWQNFVETLNKKIIESIENGINSEDKQIGIFFVSKDELENMELFSEKILSYLWEDVVKFERTLLFDEKYKNLAQLIEGYNTDGLKIFNKLFENDGEENV